MRLLDADILAYTLYEMSPAHPEAWTYLKNHVKESNKLYVTPITILETYNTLYHYYRVRPRENILTKIKLTMEILEHIETSIHGIEVAKNMNIPLGDGFLLATARENKIPVIVSNDQYVINAVDKYGLINENPISEETRILLGDYSP
ncbi:PIN domain-containing protein [Candidatus Bathyarchaeota archaeon]|nr:PIN domain-containing protein [Candidatus Bathyarchaeota archaeon]